jgi:glycosyltransferase involved in cell wall biosynthesis
MHQHLEEALRNHAEVDAVFVHVPRPGLVRRVAGASVPGLARLDLDLQPVRAKLAAAWLARRATRGRAREVDVVHWYTHNAALLAADLVRSVPSVVSLDMTNMQNHERLPYRSPSRFTLRAGYLARRLERRVYGMASLVLAKSNWAATSVMRDYGVAAEKVCVQPFGILPGPAPARHRPARPMLVFVGRTLPRKGGDQLLRVWRSRLQKRCDLTLVTGARVPGEPGLTVRNDIGDRDGRLRPLLERSTAFVYPSEIDSSPHVVFEAMAAGLPVVVARSGGMPEQVIEGETAFVVPPRDDQALVAAVTTLLDDQARADAFGAAGRRLVEERFSMEVTVPRFIDHLQAARQRFHDR